MDLDVEESKTASSGNSSLHSGSLGSKHVMKEYLVGGEKKERKIERKKEKPKPGKEIKLSHLDDEDGDDE